jgi:hypothetical protein
MHDRGSLTTMTLSATAKKIAHIRVAFVSLFPGRDHGRTSGSRCHTRRRVVPITQCHMQPPVDSVSQFDPGGFVVCGRTATRSKTYVCTVYGCCAGCVCVRVYSGVMVMSSYFSWMRAETFFLSLFLSHTHTHTHIIAGGGHMISPTDPPPPPLASNVAYSTLQCQTAAENISVATSHLLTLIRTLQLSLLLMDDEAMRAEEERQDAEAQELTYEARTQAARLELELVRARQEKWQQGE